MRVPGIAALQYRQTKQSTARASSTREGRHDIARQPPSHGPVAPKADTQSTQGTQTVQHRFFKY